MKLRYGVNLIALALIGIAAESLYTSLVEPSGLPMSTPLRISHGYVRTGDFRLSGNYQYDIYIAVKEAARRPSYRDCLLGQTGNIFDNCDGHHSVINVAWVIHDRQGDPVASGTSTGENCCSYGGDEDEIATRIGSFSLPHAMTGSLEVKFIRDAEVLSPFAPRIYVSLYWYTSESLGIRDLLLALLFVAIGVSGIIIVVVSMLGLRRTALKT